MPVPHGETSRRALFPLIIGRQTSVNERIFRVPLISRTVSLAEFFVHDVIYIRVIGSDGRPGTPLGGLSIRMFFRRLRVTNGAKLHLNRRRVGFVFTYNLCRQVRDQAIPVSTKVVLVQVGLMGVGAFLGNMLSRRQFLILGAFQFTGFVFVFFARTTVGYHFRSLRLSFYTRSSVQGVPRSPLGFGSTGSNTKF